MRSHPTYSKYCAVVCLFLSLSVIPFNFVHADEVIMKDGSRLIGTFVSMKSNNLVFETSFAGNITIKWDQVARLSTEKPVEASFGDRQVYKGKVIPSDEGTIILKPAKGPETAPLTMADVKTLSPPESASKVGV